MWVVRGMSGDCLAVQGWPLLERYGSWLDSDCFCKCGSSVSWGWRQHTVAGLNPSAPAYVVVHQILSCAFATATGLHPNTSVCVVAQPGL